MLQRCSSNGKYRKSMVHELLKMEHGIHHSDPVWSTKMFALWSTSNLPSALYNVSRNSQSSRTINVHSTTCVSSNFCFMTKIFYTARELLHWHCTQFITQSHGSLTSVVRAMEKAKLPLSPNSHPLTDSHQILHTWLCPVHHICPQATFGQDHTRGLAHIANNVK